MNLYLENGYIDMRQLIYHKARIVLIVAARGTGKTFGFFNTVLEDDLMFLYMRRTQTQLDAISVPYLSPLVDINKERGWSYSPFTLARSFKPIYKEVNVDGKRKADGKIKGMFTCLSTFSNLRGLSGYDIEIIGYDEFIPQPEEKRIKEEGASLMNAYETINRNRELTGRFPVKLLCMANSNDLANPVMMELGVVTKAQKMIERGQEISYLKERGILIVIPQKSRISEMKKDTALYKAVSKESSFYNMSVENRFNLELTDFHSENLREYKAVCAVGEIGVYVHKSNERYYISACQPKGIKEVYGITEYERKIWKNRYRWILTEIMCDNVLYESYAVYNYLKNLLK